MIARVPKPRIRAAVSVTNKKRCVQCGGMFLPVPGHKTEECEHCEGYLDDLCGGPGRTRPSRTGNDDL